MLELGIDIGGTFVDGVAFDREKSKLWHSKVPVHADPVSSALTCLDELLMLTAGIPEIVSRVSHGTTLATNLLIERTGVKTAFLTTKGFRDVLEIQRGWRGRQVYDVIGYQRPDPLVPRWLRMGIPERIDAAGNELEPLDEQSLIQAIQFLKQHQVESIAVGFLHSYKNPSHELRAADIVRNHYPEARISVSSQICPEPREYERFSTCIINAYVQSKVLAYLKLLVAGLRERRIPVPLHVMQSSGGLLQSHLVETQAVRLVRSGTAAGAVAGSLVSRMIGNPNIMTIDMGGTSFDVSIVRDSSIQLKQSGEVEGHAVRMPMADVTSIGAGGGSIAWLDKGGLLQVGPRSAGADPGPACYAKGGTEPTVTDAHALLGRLPPEGLLGGRVPIQPELAEVAVDQIAERLGLSRIETAAGILSVINAAMVRAMRRVTIERGYDPRDFTLVAYGGAGPLHAVDLAQALDISEVIVPPTPGCFSALGLLYGSVETENVEPYEKRVQACIWGDVDYIFERLEEQVIDNLGEARTVVRLERYADLRYAGQGHEISLPVSDMGALGSEPLAQLEVEFSRRYEQLFNYTDAEGDMEIVALRVRGSLEADRNLPEGWDIQWPDAAASDQRRDVFFAGVGDWIATEVFSRNELIAGDRLTGPAIIEQLDSTILLPPNSQAVVDGYSNLVIQCKKP